MAQKLPVPDFVCVGAQKAGTTWLYEQLKRQNDVFIPHKECNILLREHPADFYSVFYKEWNGHDLIGDVSPAYTTKNTAINLYALNSEAKVIFLLRNPVDRAFSQYCMAKKAERIPKNISFSQTFERNLSFIRRRGDYLALINEHIQAGFDIDQIVFLDFREISTEPRNLLLKLSTFLEVEIQLKTEIAFTKFAEATKRNIMARNDRIAVTEYYKSKLAGFEEYVPWAQQWWD